MIIHFHFSYSENSGEIRRIKNINKDVAFQLSDEVIEVAFVSFFFFLNKRKARFKLNDKELKKYYIPMLPFSYSRLVMKKINSFWISFILFLMCLKYSPKYLIGEYSIAGQALKFISKKYNVIIDVHGATREEYEYSVEKPDYKLAKYYDYLETFGLNKSKYIICQSDEMKRFLLQKYSFLSENKIYVYRCGVDMQNFFYDGLIRKQYREKLKLSDKDILLVYSGGLHKWQKIEDVLDLFSTFSKVYTTAKLLILTLDKEKAIDLIRSKCPFLEKNITVKSVSHNEVSCYLNAADAAFLLRDNVVLNAVAFPTKLAEYLACGLPVISTEVSKYWLENNKFIYNVEEKNIINLLDFIKNIDKKQIMEFSKKLSIDNDRAVINQLIRNEKK